MCVQADHLSLSTVTQQQSAEQRRKAVALNAYTILCVLATKCSTWPNFSKTNSLLKVSNERATFETASCSENETPAAAANEKRDESEAYKSVVSSSLAPFSQRQLLVVHVQHTYS